MTQHTNRFSQQDAIPRAQTALPERKARQCSRCGHREREGSGWRQERRIWDAVFNTVGMSCQPCHEGNSCIPVCTADLCHKAWLYEPFRDVTCQKGSWGNYLLGCSFISPGTVPPANAEGCAGHILGMAHSSAQPDKDARHWDQWELAGLGARSKGCPKRPASTSQERDGQIRRYLLPHVLAKPNW